ncbi:hypothetical protein [Paenibacillus durus]|uniref:hypothetical protein n=1 Tax=Paenibacillus durus TaxID=44251 RepID=UPI000A67B515|nr:hypothetical protein [Paenibacillus durus]
MSEAAGQATSLRIGQRPASLSEQLRFRAMRRSGRSGELIGKRGEGQGGFRCHCRKTPRSTASGCQTLPVGRGVS